MQENYRDLETESIEKRLCIIQYFEVFDKTCLLKNDTHLVLNSLFLYGLNENRRVQEEVDFKVTRDEVGRRVVIPIVSYPHYALIGGIICLFPDEERLLAKYAKNQKSAA